MSPRGHCGEELTSQKYGGSRNLSGKGPLDSVSFTQNNRRKINMKLNELRKHVLKTLAFSLFLGLSVIVAAAQTPISVCGTIPSSGSYQLTGNLSTAGDCLVVAAGVTNVTIDLNGFTILGDGTGSGVRGVGTFEGLTVRNGTIKNFNVGLNLFGNTMLIEKMVLIRNTGTGLTAVENIIVKDSIFTGNLVGLSVGEGSVLIGNIVNFNSSDGMLVIGAGTTVINNSARRNGGRGMVVECASDVIGNTVTNNSGGNLFLRGSFCNSNNNVSH
jgi:hypothetical protein